MRTNNYVQLDPSVIEQARQMDLLSYLQSYEPSNLQRVAGNVYCTKEHDCRSITKSKLKERIFPMNEYKIDLTAHYEKTVSVFANSSEQAQEKMKMILFDTDLINFTDEDFICGEAFINDENEDDCENNDASSEEYDDCDCSGCPNYCPVYDCCMCEDEE